jgi:hypothetical protein
MATLQITPNPKNIPLIILFTILILLGISKKCNSQTHFYPSITIEPIIQLIGLRVDLTIDKVGFLSSYSIGKAPFENNNEIKHSLFEEYQLGIGYTFIEIKPNFKRLLILSPIISYNKKDHKFYKIGYGFAVLLKINNKFHITTNIDLRLWSTTIGFGINI